MSDFNVPGFRPNKNAMKFWKSTVRLRAFLLSPTGQQRLLDAWGTVDLPSWSTSFQDRTIG